MRLAMYCLCFIWVIWVIDIVLVGLGYYNKMPWTECLNSVNLLFLVLGAEVHYQGATLVGFSWELSLWLADDFLLTIHSTCDREGERRGETTGVCSGVSLYKHTNPIMGALPSWSHLNLIKLNYLRKTAFPNIVTLGVKSFSIWTWWWGVGGWDAIQFQSTHSSEIPHFLMVIFPKLCDIYSAKMCFRI